MLVVVRPVESEGEALCRLGNEIRKRWEEEDRKLMEKYAQIETKYQAKKLPKLRRGNEAQRRQGFRRKEQNGGRVRSSGLERSRSVDAWGRKRRGKGKRKN